MRQCEWCAVRLRWWQRIYCRTCKRSMSIQAHAGKGSPWTPKGSRADAKPDGLRGLAKSPTRITTER